MQPFRLGPTTAQIQLKLFELFSVDHPEPDRAIR
jgi:hypothetical protein